MTELVTHSEFSLLADLAHTGALTPTSLHLDPDTDYDHWAALGTMLGRLSHASCWLVGDWVAFGEMAYGERCSQAIENTGLAFQTIQNYASVARRIPPSRRRATLPYSSHAVVAALEPSEQERLLALAEAEGWSRRELEQHVKGAEEPERHNCPDCGREHVVQT